MPEIDLDLSWGWVAAPWGPALQCRPLAPVAAHLFTTRAPVLKGGAHEADAGWAQVAEALGLPLASLVRLEQVHGRSVLVAVDGQGQVGQAAPWGVADAAVTRSGELGVSVRVADCVPALLADVATGAVAAVHAGWRGTAAGVAGAAVEALVSACGTNPGDVVVAIGPSIGPCCYLVGDDVEEAFTTVEAWRASLGRWLTASPPRPARHGIPGTGRAGEGGRSLFLDTWTANADQYADAGVPTNRIYVCGLCTSCYRDVFHSYRVDGPRAGRMVAAIRARKPGVRRE